MSTIDLTEQQPELEQSDTRVATTSAGPLVATPAQSLTPAQARVDSVARTMDSAMNKASTLVLKPEEIAGLQADFPDEAFKPGAAGKESLIYIEHAFLRDRLNTVIGLGQWALLRTRPHWAEEYTTQKNEPATRIYADCALLVRGCMVSEAIGEMTYFPNNASQNYGDAAEGAMTAAFRRCAKNFGIGLQAWKKDWCLGWWERQRAGQRAGTPRTQAPQAPPARAAASPAAPAPKTAPAPVPPSKPLTEKQRMAKYADVMEKSKAKFIALVKPTKEGPALEHFRRKDTNGLLPNETLEDLPASWMFPSATVDNYETAIKTDFDIHMEAIKAIVDADAPPMEDPGPGAEPEDEPTVPRDRDADLTGEAWRDFPVPFGPDKGTRLEDLDKKKLYGWAMNFEVSTTYQGKDGKTYNKKPEQIETDRKFRVALDGARAAYKFDERA